MGRATVKWIATRFLSEMAIPAIRDAGGNSVGLFTRKKDVSTDVGYSWCSLALRKTSSEALASPGAEKIPDLSKCRNDPKEKVVERLHCGVSQITILSLL